MDVFIEPVAKPTANKKNVRRIEKISFDCSYNIEDGKFNTPQYKHANENTNNNNQKKKLVICFHSTIDTFSFGKY